MIINVVQQPFVRVHSMALRVDFSSGSPTISSSSCTREWHVARTCVVSIGQSMADWTSLWLQYVTKSVLFSKTYSQTWIKDQPVYKTQYLIHVVAQVLWPVYKGQYFSLEKKVWLGALIKHCMFQSCSNNSKMLGWCFNWGRTPIGPWDHVTLFFIINYPKMVSTTRL